MVAVRGASGLERGARMSAPAGLYIRFFALKKSFPASADAVRGASGLMQGCANARTSAAPAALSSSFKSRALLRQE